MKLTPKQIYDLFVHRKDVFIEHKPDGNCFPKRREITVFDIIDHLIGKNTYSVYVIGKDNTVKWLAVDLDKKVMCPNCNSSNTYILKRSVTCLDCKENRYSKEATLLYLKALVIYFAFPEFKRMLEWSGRKGYHIWVFFDEPIYAGLAKIIAYSRLHRLKIKNVEVFPKQEKLSENIKYGSSLKIPFGKHKVTSKRTRILEMDMK